ncbi:hypothetical protein ACH79_06460 [Bradyrhizobium sp. CCBAU 051011]|uniref:hypothetical protein n=1 Tax=Bradyrhizobium sp. CCBAU 051011 TaxID=858422 RepID=UPI001373FDEB|nr:hypothetical protein [Bradyrhizobium sp. CCBAU 051011]QHO72321.1 hypothetical protein ACH79_06460 [Bradyrhizobium sp. CCBAU 051011]
MRQQTWFAVAVCTIGTLLGFVVGGLLMLVSGAWSASSDFLYLRALFGIETPGKIYQFIFGEGIPSFIQAVIAGFIAVWIMEKVAKGANLGLAAMITGGLWTGFLIFLLLFSLRITSFTTELLLSMVQGVGLWIGLASAAASLPAPSRSAIA